MKSFYQFNQSNRFAIQNLHSSKKSIHIFSWDIRKIAASKISENSQENIFNRAPLQKLELSDVPHLTILTTDSTAKVFCE